MILSDIPSHSICHPHHDFCCKNCSNMTEIIKYKLGIMNYENFSLFLKTHAGGDDKLWINLLNWPKFYCKCHSELVMRLHISYIIINMSIEIGGIISTRCYNYYFLFYRAAEFGRGPNYTLWKGSKYTSWTVTQTQQF